MSNFKDVAGRVFETPVLEPFRVKITLENFENSIPKLKETLEETVLFLRQIEKKDKGVERTMWIFSRAKKKEEKPSPNEKSLCQDSSWLWRHQERCTYCDKICCHSFFLPSTNISDSVKSFQLSISTIGSKALVYFSRS